MISTEIKVIHMRRGHKQICYGEQQTDALQTLYYTNTIVTENSTLAAKPVCHNKYLIVHNWSKQTKCNFNAMLLRSTSIQCIQTFVMVESQYVGILSDLI